MGARYSRRQAASRRCSITRAFPLPSTQVDAGLTVLCLLGSLSALLLVARKQPNDSQSTARARARHLAAREHGRAPETPATAPALVDSGPRNSQAQAPDKRPNETADHEQPAQDMVTVGEPSGLQLSMLPEAAFADLLSRVQPEDIRAVRSVCQDWRALTSACLTSLAPRALVPKDLTRTFPHLTSLDLGHCTQGVRASYLKIVLKSLTQLTELQLGCPSSTAASSSGWAVTDRCLMEVARSGTALQSLGLGQCVHVGDAGLVAVRSMARLRRLDLSGCVSVTEVGVLMLSQMPALTHLDLSWCLKLSDAGVKALTAAHSRLISLDISGCPLISATGVSYLGALTRLTSLHMTHMGLAAPPITDDCLVSLCDLKELSHFALGCIKVGHMEVSDYTLQHLASRHPQLRALELHSLHSITDAGVLQLSAALGHQLTRLVLRTCVGITQACLSAIADMPQLQELELLGCSPLQLTSETLPQLMQRTVLQGLSTQATTPSSDTPQDAQHALVDPSSSTQASQLSAVHSTDASQQVPVDEAGSTHGTEPWSLQASESAEAGPLGVVHNQQTVQPHLTDHTHSREQAQHTIQPARAPQGQLAVDSTEPSTSGSVHSADVHGPSTLRDATGHDGPVGGPDSDSAGPSVGTGFSTQDDTEAVFAGPSVAADGPVGGPDRDSAGPSAGPGEPNQGAEHADSTALVPLAPLTSTTSVPTLLNIRSLTLGSAQAHSLDRDRVQGIDDTCLALLEPLGPTLRSLTLVTWTGTLQCPEAEQALQALSRLTHLEFIGCRRVDDPGWLALAASPCAPSLRTLTLVQPGPLSTPSGLTTLLSSCTSLTALTMRGCMAVDDAVACAVGGRLKGLRDLQVQGATLMTDAGLEALQALKGLTGLMLSGCDNITGMGFKAWPHVRKGTPSSTRRHSAPGTPHASASDPPMHCKLQSVSLSVCTALSDQAIQHLCMAAPGLVRLDFSQCGQITDRALSALVTLPHLTSLDIQHCSRVSDQGLASLAQLTHLATLRMTGCLWVGNEGVRALTALHSVLLTLHLDKCVRISNDGLESLAKITSLTSLRLGRCPEITDTGLTSLLRLTRLSTLSLEHCDGVTMAGLMTLTPLTAIASLTW